MRIVQITTDARDAFKQYHYEEPYFGTAPTALFQGFRGMAGVELHIVSCSPVAMRAPAYLGDNIWFHQPLVSSLGWGKTCFQGCIRTVRRLLKEIKPDIVHGQGTERDCAMDAAFSGYPNVLTLHGNMRVHAKRGENKDKAYYRLAAFLEGIALRRTDGVVCISSYTDELVKPLAKRTWLLPNAADARYFNAHPVPENPPFMLFVGGLDERKNPAAFIRASKDLFESRGWRLRLCGTGVPGSPYVKELEELANENAWVELAGWKSREELLSEMERASALVLPTLEDNCPMVVLEAMAVGLPVIASRVGGVPDLIKDGETGLMFDPQEASSMLETTERILSDAPLRIKLGEAAKREARKRFHPEVIARAHLDIYREVLGR